MNPEGVAKVEAYSNPTLYELLLWKKNSDYFKTFFIHTVSPVGWSDITLFTYLSVPVCILQFSLDY